MRLYHVQDGDYPMYVVAEDWNAALAAWEARMREEGGLDAGEEVEGPSGIALICEERDLILPPRTLAALPPELPAKPVAEA